MAAAPRKFPCCLRILVYASTFGICCRYNFEDGCQILVLEVDEICRAREKSTSRTRTPRYFQVEHMIPYKKGFTRLCKCPVMPPNKGQPAGMAFALPPASATIVAGAHKNQPRNH